MSRVVLNRGKNLGVCGQILLDRVNVHSSGLLQLVVCRALLLKLGNVFLKDFSLFPVPLMDGHQVFYRRETIDLLISLLEVLYPSLLELL
jgi:hypothetical protein